MPNKIKRRIGFLRADERKAEEARMRVANHVSKCNAFADEIYQVLLIQTPEQTDLIIQTIQKLLYGNMKNDNNT